MKLIGDGGWRWAMVSFDASSLDLRAVLLLLVAAAAINALGGALSGFGWRIGAKRNLELYESLAAHARNESEMETAEKVRAAAFAIAERGVTRPRRAGDTASTLLGTLPIFSMTLVFVVMVLLFIPESLKESIVVLGAAGAIDMTAMVVRNYLSKRKNGKSERSGEERQTDVNEHGQEGVDD